MPELDPLTVVDVLSAVRGDPSELAARRVRGSPRLERAAYPEQGPGEGDAAVWARVLQDPWHALGGVTNQLTGVNQERYQVGPERALRAPGKAMAGGYGQPLSEEFVEASLPDAQRMAGLAAVGGAPRSSVGSGGARPAAAVGEPHAHPPAPTEAQRVLSQLLTPVEVPRYEGPASRANPEWAFLGENRVSNNRWNPGVGSYPILAPTGQPRRLGNLDVTVRGPTVHVDMVGRDTMSSWRGRREEGERQEGGGAGALGTTGTKGLLMGVRRQFPEAENIEGYRVSGARAANRGGSRDARMRIPRFSPEAMEAYEDARARALGWRPRLDAAEEKISRTASELRSQARDEPPPDWNFTGRVGEPEPAGGAAPRATSASGGAGAGHLNAEGLRHYADMIARRDRVQEGGLPWPAAAEQEYRAYTDLRNGRMPRDVDDVDFSHVRVDNGGPAARASREVPWTGADVERLRELTSRPRTTAEQAEMGSLLERQRVAGRSHDTDPAQAALRGIEEALGQPDRGGGITQAAVDAERVRAARETAPRTERWEQVGREYNDWLRQNDLPNMSMDELAAEIAPGSRRRRANSDRAQGIRDQLAEFQRRWEASDYESRGHAGEPASEVGTNYIPREAPPAVTPQHVMEMPAGRGERQAMELARRYDLGDRPAELWERYNELYAASDRPGFGAQQEFHDLHDFFFGTGSRAGPVRTHEAPSRDPAAQRSLSDLNLADIHAALDRAGYSEDINQFSDLRYEGPSTRPHTRYPEHRYSYEFEGEDGPERGSVVVWRLPNGRLMADYAGGEHGH